MRALRRLSVGLVGALLLAGCGGYSPTAFPPPTTPTPADAAVAAPTTCGVATRSYDPLSSLPKPGQGLGPTVQKIYDNKKIVVGVSADQYLLGFLNPQNGNIQGFDIDMADYIARAIFGEDGHVELKVITSKDRIPDLQKGLVDIVARNMTINCDRWTQIAFSAEYYHSSQKILVRKGEDKRIHTLADLNGLRVCAPAGTTSLDNLRSGAPQAISVVTFNDAECLLDFQKGTVDAITTDDTVLAGLAAQDPYAVVADTPPLSAEPYGIGVNKDHQDLVQFINAVLVQIHDNGDWQRSYDKWLGPYLGVGKQPTPVYGR